MNSSIVSWISLNSGKRMHPSEVLSFLESVSPNPEKEYTLLERSQRIVPTSYKNGEVDGVLVRSLLPKRIVDIAYEQDLSFTGLFDQLRNLSKSSKTAHQLGLPRKAIEELVEHNYLRRIGPFYALGPQAKSGLLNHKKTRISA